MVVGDKTIFVEYAKGRGEGHAQRARGFVCKGVITMHASRETRGRY